ncbi:hypothetical protein GCM10027168_23690 [Streptomyces capparidis]
MRPHGALTCNVHRRDAPTTSGDATEAKTVEAVEPQQAKAVDSRLIDELVGVPPGGVDSFKSEITRKQPELRDLATSWGGY